MEEGLYGVGGFLVNHILGTLNYCGAIPQALHNIVTIGEGTGSYIALKKLHLHDSIPEILEALSIHLKIDRHAAEELVCITGCNDHAAKVTVCRLGDKLGVIRNKRAHYTRGMGSDTVEVQQISPAVFLLPGRNSLGSYWSMDLDTLPKWSPKYRCTSSSTAKQPRMVEQVPCKKMNGKEQLLLQLVHSQKIYGHKNEPHWNCLGHKANSFLWQQRCITVTLSGQLVDKEEGDDRKGEVVEVKMKNEEQQGGVKFPSGNYSKWTVKLPALDGLDSRIVDADPDFPLRDDYPNAGGSIVDPRTQLRYFKDDEKAKCFSLLSALFVYTGHMAMHSYGRRFWETPAPDEDLSVPLGSWQDNDDVFHGNKAGGVGGHRVSYKVMGALTAKQPYVVSLLHSRGGTVHYLVDDVGRCNSGVIVTPARAAVGRVVPGREEVIDDCGIVAGIVGHRHQGCAQVCVGWMDGVTATWEKVAEVRKHSAYHLRQYGMRNNLHSEIGWRSLLNDSKKSDFDGYPRFQVTYSPLKEAVQAERMRRKRKATGDLAVG